MKKLVAALLCFLMLLSLFSCRNKSIEDINYNPDNSTSSNVSDDPTTNNTSAIYDSVLRVYRRIVDSYPIVNQNPQALAAEFGIQDDRGNEAFIRLYSSIHQFYPGRWQDDSLSPHYKLKCGYAIKDINRDGVDELVLLTDDYRIIAVCSLVNGIPVLLGNYFKEDKGSTCRNWIDAEGRIHVVRAVVGDLYHHSISEISNGQLIELCTYGHDVFRENGEVIGKLYQTINEKTTFITEQDINELNRQYKNPLNADEAANITKDSAGFTFTSLYTEAEIAMEMYEQAIKGEICIIDEHLGEIKLKDCQFPNDNLRLGECEILSKAILDMDGDGINEYVIQSPQKNHIILHYCDGKIYTYAFDSCNFYNLNTDGSFYWLTTDGASDWYDSFQIGALTRGLSQIVFDGPKLSINEIYVIKKISSDSEGYEFYMDGKQLSRKEFSDYDQSNHKTVVIFSPLDISCEYPISSEKAYELASDYWGIESGTSEGAAGKRYVNRIIILEKPNGDTPSYRISWQWEEYFNHVPDTYYSLPAHCVIMYKEVLVDAITGECISEITNPNYDGID